MSMSPLFGSALKRRKTSPAVECSRRKFVLFDHSTPSTSNSVTNSHSHSRTDSHTVALSDRVTECERIITRQGDLIEEQSRSLEDLKRKLTEYNHRFYDLAEVLKTGESSILHEKVSALIQPVRGASTPSHNVKEQLSSDLRLQTTYTSVIDRGTKATNSGDSPSQLVTTGGQKEGF
ncbi:hypothetical protein EB796_006492 [Bugula neritina]|uniref:Uncharacterized protein n=1 Tax=Bugula neritina TaxID=10212 RepID=A0A7J7KB94_BUGNE|nr:hypothetical protein EB796_006492 [Bugula neritina]